MIAIDRIAEFSESQQEIPITNDATILKMTVTGGVYPPSNDNDKHNAEQDESHIKSHKQGE